MELEGVRQLSICPPDDPIKVTPMARGPASALRLEEERNLVKLDRQRFEPIVELYVHFVG
jgi:hypothetical protein